MGSYEDSIGGTHGFVYSTSTQQFRNINNPYAPYGTLSISDINDSGQIVGFYHDAAGNTNGFVGSPQNPVRH